jgi:hypothetical protein
MTRGHTSASAVLRRLESFGIRSVDGWMTGSAVEGAKLALRSSLS